MAKVIVTGGAGFIGANLTRALLDRGDEVHVIDTLVASTRERVPKGAVLHEVDIRDTESLIPLCAGVRYLFHCAALPRVQFSIENPIETHAVNITGTLSVLEAARQAKVGRVVYSASSSAYGDQKVLPLVESMAAQPKSPYGLQKYVGELLCKVWSEVYGLSTVSLRYFNVYGSGLDPDGPYALVIGKFLAQRKNGEPLTITGDGEQTRDFTHMRDVVRANLLAAGNVKVGKGEVLNIGAGRDVSIKKLAELIGGPINFVPARLEPKHTKADASLAKELIGWEPTVRFEDGIAELKKEWGLS